MSARRRTRHVARLGTAAVAAVAVTAGVLVALASTSSAVNSTADARNIVTNSNFAAPPVTAAINFATYAGGDSTSIPGWTVGGNTVDLNDAAYLAVPAGDPASTQTIDLTGGNALGSVTQTLPTVAGYHYTGSYELAGNVNCGTDLIKTGTLTVGSLAETFTFDSTGKTATNMGWTQVNFAFVASGGATPITFASTTGGSCGPVITDVDVDAPLPASITTVANQQVLQTTPTGTPVSFVKPTATDGNTGAALPVSCSATSGATFPVGATTVTCSATEPEGPTATTSFTVTVKKVVGSCEARGVGFDASKSLSIDQSNPATSPCVTSTGTLLTTNATLIPGLLGIGAVTVKGTVLSSGTTATYGPTAAAVSALDQIASITFVAPGLSVSATTIKSSASATLNASCVGTSHGSSDIEGLVINGKHYTVGTAPLTIALGLGLELNLNQTIVVGNVVTQRAFSITSTHPNVASYHTVIGEAVAGLSCG